MGGPCRAPRGPWTSTLVLLLVLIIGSAQAERQHQTDEQGQTQPRKLRMRLGGYTESSSETQTVSSPTLADETGEVGSNDLPPREAAVLDSIEVGSFIEPSSELDCKLQLEAADMDRNNELSSSEFTTFIELASEERVEGPFDELDAIYVLIYYSVACTYCAETTGDETCCVGSNAAAIDLESDGSVDFVCRNVEVAVDEMFAPTAAPAVPTRAPISRSPTTFGPTANPSAFPSALPSRQPSPLFSRTPSQAPTTSAPTDTPTRSPTDAPTLAPTNEPTLSPTDVPSSSPSATPSGSPSGTPSSSPTLAPTDQPSPAPSSGPSAAPSIAPTTDAPTRAPITPASPTATPTTATPTEAPTTGTPTEAPTTARPTIGPTIAARATAPPSPGPSLSPTQPLVCVTFGYELKNQLGLSAMDIFNEVNNTIKQDLIDRTEQVVSDILNATDDFSTPEPVLGSSEAVVDDSSQRYGRFRSDPPNPRRLVLQAEEPATADRAIELALTDFFGSDRARELIATYQDRIHNDWNPNSRRKRLLQQWSREMAFYSEEFPPEILLMIDSPFCPSLDPTTLCAVVSSRACVVLEEGDDPEVVQLVLIEGLRDSINSGDFANPPVL